MFDGVIVGEREANFTSEFDDNYKTMIKAFDGLTKSLASEGLISSAAHPQTFLFSGNPRVSN